MYEDFFNEYIIGKKVRKKSNKPFKSKLKINTIKNITINKDNHNELAFTFIEDDSIVSVVQCVFYNGE